ncbi:phosphoadenylyl-sulfate reductase [Candidatus Laterigemmans baculatus]|uniref:phosphoadenylyl-sulfate reductase n=1 Tax=Candidatus Laterigemmans baculatus TaxID=2770505 RepID=UPI0013D9EC96|nr:phosphoadenylyl-sulfate reductase [Candidatus Laterigemmans baculatus]
MAAPLPARTSSSLPVASSGASSPPKLRVLNDVPGDASDQLELRGALAADPPLEPTETFLAELAEESQRLESASPEEILRWAAERFAPRFTMATAFGPEGMCLIHMLAEVAPKTPIFNLETGYQFKETLELRETVRRRYGIEVEYKYPELTVEQYEAANGGPVYKTDPNRCCGERKLEVLHRAARGQYAWASAIRRDQSPDRAKAPIVGWDKKFQLVKVSPLANWTKQQVWGLITSQNIPYNPLHDRGYPSVGCWPCTRSVMDGEDERAGRWSGFEKTECGLHSS